MIGPEAADGLLDAAVKEAGCAIAEPLGAYPAIGKLTLSNYMNALGIAPQQQMGASAR